MITISEFVGGALWKTSQPFGQTPFGLSHLLLYKYGESYCLPPGTHPGIDIGVPTGTRLYCPAEGVVIIAGSSPVFTDERYGNIPQSGQLKIRTDDDRHVIIGHMEYIDVS